LMKKAPLIISIAAGIRINSILNWLDNDAAIVRVMPNTPALIGAGAAGLFANDVVSESEKELAQNIMNSVGISVWLEDESQIDIVTAISGSGPAYYLLVMELMEKAALSLGLTADQAKLLVTETALGAARMVKEGEIDAASLRRQVTSPGGTTEEALKILTEGNIENLFQAAVEGACRRSVELSDRYGGES